MRKNNKITFSKFIFKLFKEFKWSFIIMQLSTTAWAFQEALLPLFIKEISERILNSENNKDNFFYNNSKFLLISLLIYLVIEVGHRVNEYVSLKFYPQLRKKIREIMLEYTLDHSQEFFQQNYAGTIGDKIFRLADGINQSMLKVINTIVPIFLMVVISSYLIFQANGFLGSIVIVWFFIHLAIIFKFAKKCQYHSHIFSEEVTKLNGKIVDIFYNIANVRLFARKKFEIKKLLTDNDIEIQASIKSSLIDFRLNFYLAINAILFVILLLTGSIIAWQKNIIDLPTLLLATSPLGLIGLVWWFGYNIVLFYGDVGQCEESLELLRTPLQVKEQKDANNLTVNKGKIEFKNIYFTFDSNRTVFKDLNLEINSNEKVGLVGYSGAGKSTLCNLLLRLYDIENGEILIDKQNIANVSLESLREAITFIPQDLILFHRTVKENIAYGNIDATDEEIITASKKALADDFIKYMPEGYDSQVGERGTRLSGGQRQRIAIARALLKDSKIIIMDEATSALDNITEYYIQKEIYKNITDKTLIVIAHRLSTLIDMDRIIVFKDGKIVQNGSHNELIKIEGHYKDLWEKQEK